MAAFCHLKSIVLDPQLAIRFWCENDHLVELQFIKNNGETNLKLESI